MQPATPYSTLGRWLKIAAGIQGVVVCALILYWILSRPPEHPRAGSPETSTPAKVGPTSTSVVTRATPPPALAKTKLQRLTELLNKYKKDEITPTEYHEQRARILAEP
jgi:hypothetical protein